MKTKFKAGDVVVWNGTSSILTEDGSYSLATEYIIQSGITLTDDIGLRLFIDEEDFTLAIKEDL